jgi:polyphosphate kinase
MKPAGELPEHSSMSANVLVSIGDHGILNTSLSNDLADVWMDRDLSWLDFNERVLAEALDDRTPLLERVKFLAIFSSNLDEFFMKRIAVLREKSTPERSDLLKRIREKLVPTLRRQSDCFRNDIIPGLAAHGITFAQWHELTSAQRDEASSYFDDQLSAALTPLVIDSAHSFPFLSNLSTSLVFSLRSPDSEESRYARVKVPGVLRQWVSLKAGDGGQVMIHLREIIRGNLEKLYLGMEIGPVTMFRLTRDAEVELDEGCEDEPLTELVQEQVRQRRYEPAVRLEFATGAEPIVKDTLRERFKLSDVDIYDAPEELDYTALFEIAGMDICALRDRPWSPIAPLVFEDAVPDMFAAIREADVLVHHPYDSFDASVERFVAEAANDPQTVAIKMTAYRIGDDTPFVKSLIHAAESGKQVACAIEIKARFDEERNLHWAAELEKAGAHVVYGVRRLKTHAKTALVVRKEGGALRTYAHVATGNYHVRTARLYADFGLFTTDPVITQDVVRLFHYLTGHSQAPTYTALLVAPDSMRSRFLELIAREIENRKKDRPARIVAKMNQLEDPEVIRALLEAAAAGVPIELVVRGLCCLRPGIPGRTEGIRVRSVIGRFLEHSRIFYFAAGQEDPVDGEFYIGSADWMHRNLSKRVEVVTPILARPLKKKLWEVLDTCLRDHRQAWIMNSDGSYTRLQPEGSGDGPENLGTHQYLMELAHRSADPMTSS